MKNLFIISIAFLTISGCIKNNPPSKGETLRTDFPGREDEREPGVIPSNIGVVNLLDKKEKTWKDVDKYYNDVVKSKHSDKDYYDNLRGIVFDILINEYHFQKEAPKIIILSYFREMQDISCLPDATAYLECIKSLENDFSKADIKKLANERYNSNMSYLKENFDNLSELPENVLASQGKLKAYADSIVILD